MIDEDWVRRWVAAVDGATIEDEPAEPAIVVWECGPLRWWLRVEGDAVRAGRGDPAGSATVTFSSDVETASAISAGTLAVEDAVLDGRLAVRGEVVRLPELRPVLDAAGTAARGSTGCGGG